VITPRPGRIMDDIEVKIPRPRTLEAMNIPEFGAFVHAIRGRFNAKGVIDA
jgi:NitT/TauT family transport system ATP-binding protein